MNLDKLIGDIDSCLETLSETKSSIFEIKEHFCNPNKTGYIVQMDPQTYKKYQIFLNHLEFEKSI